MIKLWLDDERDPNSRKIQELFGAEPNMIWVKTVPAAISRLKSGNVEYISLDHDLGTTATGYDVAKWIEEQAFNGTLNRINWAVHSMNTEGSKAIRNALLNADKYWDTNEN